MSESLPSIKPFSVPPEQLSPPSSPASAASPAAFLGMAAAASGVSSVATSSGGHKWWKYLLILVIIGFLMMMLFVYFAKKYIPNLSLIFDVLGAFGASKMNASSATAAGATGATGAAATAATTTVQPKLGDSQTPTTEFKKQDETVLAAELSTTPPVGGGKTVHVPEPAPDEAGSRTQAGKASSKSGFCYIGEDRGFRSCIKVGENDTCMSGNIFPTEAICINPTLRE